ncbi:MAG: M48 family metalloprotease [Beijerinckiaceae bacterium]
MLQKVGTGAAALPALLLAACITDPLANAPAQKPAPTQVSLPAAPPRASALDAVSAREHQRLVAAFGGEYRAPRAQALVAGIVERLRQATERPSEQYRVTLLNSTTVNAFALPNGNIYLTRGLIVLANDTAEIASVIAHEMAHVIARHAVDRQELERTNDLIDRVRREALQNAGADGLAREGRASIATFSRQQELEADALSVRIIARAGFDPYGATRFLDSLDRTSAIRQAMLGLQPGQRGADITATHPTTPERIQLATLAARQIGAPGLGEAERNRYLETLQGVTFADDAAQGFVRGQTFSHTKLGLTFTAPAGFILENGREAVVGFSPEGGRALRFDQAKIDGAARLETYVESGFIDGASATGVENLTLGGLQAATGIVKAEEWTYRIFAIREGNRTFRLTYAARDLTPALDAAFRQSAGTFRPLSTEERQRLRPLRIALVTAGTNDTAESLAQRMAIEEPRLERFRVLNGLQVSDRIFTGQRYKIVLD